MITVYQILKSENIKYHWKDKLGIGLVVANTYAKISDIPPVQIEQKESKGMFVVNSYPDEFKIVILNIIKEYLEKKAAKIRFTPEQIESLNKMQKSGKVHPLTCNRRSRKCETRIEPNDFSKDGVLIATKQGWVCPCGDYKQ